MLTDAEKQWLEDMDTIQFATGNFLHEPYLKNVCDDYRDAAEFEARVGEKLARGICFRCPDRYNEICPKGIGYFRLKLGIASCGMKHARLAAEAEMDAQSN